MSGTKKRGSSFPLVVEVLGALCWLCTAGAVLRAEGQAAVKERRWPEGVTRQIMVSVSNFATSKFEFDGYFAFEDYKGQWHPDLEYSPSLHGEHVRHYSIGFLDANETLIYEFPFTVDFKERYGITEAERQPVEVRRHPIGFMEWLPFPERTRRVVFMEGRTVLTEKVRSQHPPVLTLGPPEVQADEKVRIPWSVSDSDDVELQLFMKFHDDDGEHLLAHNYKLVLDPEPHIERYIEGHFVSTGSPRVLPEFLEFDSRPFQGGDNCRLEVELCDGLNSTVVLSEPFRIAYHVPDIVILSPKDGQVLREDEEVGFTVGLREPGVASYSYEDAGGVWRWKGDYQVKWVSDKDGDLGRGFPGAGLSAGQHTISVFVKGLSQTPGRDSVKVKVVPATFPEYWISPEDLTLAVDYEKPDWPTFLCVKARGKNMVGESPFDLVVKFQAQREQHSLTAGFGRDAAKDPTVVLDGRVPWPYKEAGDYEVEARLRWTGEPSLRERDNTVVKTFQWEGPADRDIPVNDYPDIRIIPGSLVVKPPEVAAGQHMADFYWQVEVRNSKGGRMGHEIYVDDMHVHEQSSHAGRCHVQRLRCYNNTCWLPKEVGTYPVKVRVKINGEPETMLDDNEITGKIRIVSGPAEQNRSSM
jgi:hypothetical protein